MEEQISNDGGGPGGHPKPRNSSLPEAGRDKVEYVARNEQRPSKPAESGEPPPSEIPLDDDIEQPGRAGAIQSESCAEGEPSGRGPSVPKYFLTFFPGEAIALPEECWQPLKSLHDRLGMQLWVYIESENSKHYAEIDQALYQEFFQNRNLIRAEENVALIIHSSGGSAHDAFRIARLFQRRAKKFAAVVPCRAKSAATLLALAADELILGADAELGPLDVQIVDREKEDVGSALDAVQALERLRAFSLGAFDQTMLLLVPRTGKKIDTLLPLALQYAATLAQPLLQSIDTVDFTRKSRDLKIGEEYAMRLLKKGYSEGQAQEVARALVEKYPTHSFVIDAAEAQEIGIKISQISVDLDPLIELICGLQEKNLPLVGLFYEVVNE